MDEVCAQLPQISSQGTLCLRWRTSACKKRQTSPVTFCISFLFLAALLSLWCWDAEAQIPSSKNVLIITEVGMSHPAAVLVSTEIEMAFRGISDYRVEFYTESLDTMTFSDEQEQTEIRGALIHKYRNHPIDAIVAMGPEAIRFLAQPSNKFFPGVPVVICCSSAEQADSPSLDSRFTGAWFDIEPGKTLDAALKLFPKTRNVYVVGGTTAYDRVAEEIVKTKLNSYQGSVTLIYVTNLKMAALLETLRHLPAQSIVLYTSLWRDGDGNQFINATVALPMISKASNAPVFGMSDTYIGHGAIGGCVVGFSQQAKIASNALLKILSGTRAEDIPIVNAPSFLMFDWKELKRWGAQDSNLPEGSIVLFREKTLWEEHPRSITVVALAVVILILLGFQSWSKQNELRLAGNALIKLSGMLIGSQEKERSRLASELHDDFSQRMALLSIGLETAEEMIMVAPHQARQKVHELIDSAGEIGADLHTVSHRLHSSTLERLGLVPGVSSFCKEFAAQKGVKVEFLHDTIPRKISPDIALCLFRVVQEALRNVKKHSGATQARVILRVERETLHLTVSDQGIGFDIDFNDCAGLGLFSMMERCRLQGGEFKVTSERRKGTSVDAWLPLHRQSKQAMPVPEPDNAILPANEKVSRS